MSDHDSNAESEHQEETAPELTKPVEEEISKLEPERIGFTIVCRVHSKKRKLCREQLNGEIIRIYEAVVYDDSGAITMTLKGEDQISAVNKGDNLILRNVKVSMHNFHMRLACDRWGLIEKDPEQRIKPKFDENGNEILPVNVSDQEYERVEDEADELDTRPHTRSPGRGRRGGGRGRGGPRGRGRRGSPRGGRRGPRGSLRGGPRGGPRGTRGGGPGGPRGPRGGRPRGGYRGGPRGRGRGGSRGRTRYGDRRPEMGFYS